MSATQNALVRFPDKPTPATVGRIAGKYEIKENRERWPRQTAGVFCAVSLRALDLFCGAGGASMGLHRAGFDVTGVDIKPQPHYPFRFFQGDALEFPLDGFDFAWASPMCQAHTWAARRWKKDWPQQIEPIRNRLVAAGIPYVIENVPGAPLKNPIRLCGEMFGLGVIRHRHFESNFYILQPTHIRHKSPIQIRGVKRSAYACVAGHGGEGFTYRLEDWRAAMGIDWMDKKELTESIPPAYSEFIGNQWGGWGASSTVWRLRDGR